MDAWVREYEDAKQLADDALAIIQARVEPRQGNLLKGFWALQSLRLVSYEGRSM